MKKKLLSLLLCVVMVLSLMPTAVFAADTAYDVWVDGGTQVTTANKDDVLGDGTVSYDPDTSTLTLSGYDGSYIKAYTALDIVLADGTENAISVPVDVAEIGIYTYGDCTIRGNGNLNIEVLHPNGAGVCVEDGDLIVDMTGDLTVNAGDNGLYADNDLTVSGSGDITVTSFYYGFFAHNDLTVSGSGNITITADYGIDAYEKVIFSGSRNIIITAGDDGISAGGGNVEINDTCKVSVDAGAGDYAVRLWNSGSKLLLNGTGAPISLKSGTGKAAVWNSADSNSPVGGSNIANYDVTGAPDTASVVYTLKSGAPIKITEIAISNTDITPVAGEKAGDHMAYTLPTDCHYAATMNGWWDILGSKIMDSDNEFEAGGLYCASWNFVADDGYAFADDTTVTINGSVDNVDTEHSYLDTTGDAPLFIVSAKGAFADDIASGTTYDVWVDGGTQVTSDNAADILGDGTVSYDPATNTLTLNNYDGGYISADMPLNIVLADGTENAVSVPAYVAESGINIHGDCTISGNGDLDVRSLYSNYSSVQADGNLIINMSGNLSVSSNASGLSSNGYITISGSGNVVIDARIYGLWPEKDVILSGSGGVTVESGKDAVRIWPNTEGKLQLNGTGSQISLTAGSGYKAVLNDAGESPVVGTNLANYTVTGAPNESKVIYDHVPSYDVSFEMNGHGDQITAQTVRKGDKATKPADPKASGYTFGGWYADATFSVKFDFDSAINADTTVYAKWIENSKFPFTDVKTSDWSYDDIYYVWEKGLMQGTSETTFAPKTDTSRAMIVTILWRLEGEPVVNYAMSFDDVADGQWYTEAIRWAQANNIVNGYSAKKFGPTDLITREQMAAIFYRYAEFKGYDVSAKADLSKFADSDKISGWALDAIAWANANNLVNGVSTTELAPQGKATREQVGAILHRFCENIVK